MTAEFILSETLRRCVDALGSWFQGGSIAELLRS